MLSTAKDWVRRIPLPAKEPESLHGYRKKTRAARYIAGMDKESVAARKLEKRLKQMQDAIGKWHDLALLAEESTYALGENSYLGLPIASTCEKALKGAVRSIGRNL